MTTLNAEFAGTWVRRWDAQQELYVADREERFAVIGDVVAHSIGDLPSGGDRSGGVDQSGGLDRPRTVVDLGCGPGSLAGRLAARFPAARIIGVDSDPLLLALGRATYGDRVEFVDADLAGSWLSHVPDEIDAAVSTTALHWLDPEPLADVYRALAKRLRPGGVFVDGDHLTQGEPALDTLAVHVRQGRAARAGVTGNEDWDAWWRAVGSDTELASLLSERNDRAIAHHGSNRLSVAEHRALLLAAGFAAAGTVWQSGDDHVLVGIR